MLVHLDWVWCLGRSHFRFARCYGPVAALPTLCKSSHSRRDVDGVVPDDA